MGYRNIMNRFPKLILGSGEGFGSATGNGGDIAEPKSVSYSNSVCRNLLRFRWIWATKVSGGCPVRWQPHRGWPINTWRIWDLCLSKNYGFTLWIGS